jgi:hypothetical protein
MPRHCFFFASAHLVVITVKYADVSSFIVYLSIGSYVISIFILRAHKLNAMLTNLLYIIIVDLVMPTFAGRGVSRGQRNGSPRPLISVFWTWSRYFFVQVTPQLTSRGSRG